MSAPVPKTRTEIEIKYEGKNYTVALFEWYIQAATGTGTATPSWMIRMDKKFESTVANPSKLKKFYPLAGFSMASATYGHRSIVKQADLLAGVHPEKVAIVIPYGIGYAGLMTAHTKREVLKEVEIQRLVSSTNVNKPDGIYMFKNVHIDYIGFVGGELLVMLVSYRMIQITEMSFKADGKAAGKKVFSFELDKCKIKG